MTGVRDLYTVGGVVQAGGGVYLCRQADEDLMALCRRRELAYILTARQTGKSSLMVRTAERLAADGTRVAIIDLTECGVLATPNEWYFGVVSMIGARLGLAIDLADWWQQREHISLGQRLYHFFTELVLKADEQPIVIFIDEIDSTLSLGFADDFFATIRYLYNARAQQPELRRLSFVLIGVATPMDLISDSHRTPFNIGQAITLTDFTAETARPLAAGLSPDPEVGQELLGWILEWTGGHPYLTQRVCAMVARHGDDVRTRRDVDALVTGLFLGDGGVHDSNLQFVRDMLTARARQPEETLRLYSQVLHARRRVADDPHSAIKTHLKLSGVVVADQRRLRVRNAIYASAFNQQWIKQNWPHSWWDLLPTQARFLLLLFAVTFVALTFVSFAALRAGGEARDAAALAATGEAKALEAQTQAQAEGRRAAGLASLASMRSLIAQAQVALSRSQPRIALLQAIMAMRLAAALQLYSLPAAETVLRQAVASLSGTSLIGHTGRIRDLDLSADGRWLVTGADDNLAIAWPLYDADPAAAAVRLAGHTARVRTVAVTPDGSWAVTGSDDGTVGLWNLRADDQAGSGRIIQAHPPGAVAVRSSADGRWLATAGVDGLVRIWSLEEEDLETPVATFEGPGGWIWDLAYSPDGRYLAANSRTTTVRVWDITMLPDQIAQADLAEQASQVRSIDFSPDSQYLATGTADGNVYLYRTSVLSRTTRPRKVLVGDQAQIALAFSPDSRLLASGGVGNTIRVWSTSELDGDEPLLLEGHEGLIIRLAFAPEGGLLVSSSSDNTIRIWDLNKRPDVSDPQVLRAHDATVVDFAISADGRWLASGSWDGTAHFWDMMSPDFPAPITPRVLRIHAVPAYGAAFTPDDRRVLTSGFDRQVYGWDLVTGSATPDLDVGLVTAANPTRDLAVGWKGDEAATLWDFRGPEVASETIEGLSLEAAKRSVALSEDGHWLLSFATSGELVLLDLWSNEPEKTPLALPYQSANPTSVHFSGQGNWLLLVLDNSQGLVWRLNEDGALGEPLVLTGHSGVWDGWFSPDGRWLATGGQDQSVRLWDLEAADPTQSPIVLPVIGRVYETAFSEDGRWLLVGLGDFRGALWELQGLRPDTEPITLGGHSALVYAVAISPDSHWAATASFDNTIRLWDLYDEDPESTMVQLTGHTRGITTVEFSHDSQWLVSGDRNGAFMIWPMARETVLEMACAAAGRDFTDQERQRVLGNNAIPLKACPQQP